MPQFKYGFSALFNVGSILKLNTKTLIRYQSFERHGFTFTRNGLPWCRNRERGLAFVESD